MGPPCFQFFENLFIFPVGLFRVQPKTSRHQHHWNMNFIADISHHGSDQLSYYIPPFAYSLRYPCHRFPNQPMSLLTICLPTTHEPSNKSCTSRYTGGINLSIQTIWIPKVPHLSIHRTDFDQIGCVGKPSVSTFRRVQFRRTSRNSVLRMQCVFQYFIFPTTKNSL